MDHKHTKKMKLAHQSSLMNTKSRFYPFFGNKGFDENGVETFGHFEVLGTMNRQGDFE